MEIIEFKQRPELQNKIIAFLNACEWGAGKFLAECICENKILTDEDSILFLIDGENIVSFLTLAKRDCVDDDTLFTWIGFVYTAPEYRGHRYCGKLLEFALDKARKQGFNAVYLATDHVGLYEKYGFTYKESRIDVYNEMSRIYVYYL